MLGSMANVGVSLLFSYKKSVFNHLRGRDWRACLYQFLAELTINTREFVEKERSLMCSLEFL